MIVEVNVSDGKIVSYLRKIGERKLLSLLLEVLDNRSLKVSGSWPLSIAIEDEGRIYLVADGGDDWVEDAHLCQFGQCCVPLASWAKDAQCPLCGEKVYLT